MITVIAKVRARLASGAGDDAGVSLLEVLVAGAISIVVMAMGLTFFVRSITSTDDTTADSTNVSQARVVLDSWSSLVRVADSPVLAGTSAGRFETIGQTDLVFYANVDNRKNLTAVQPPQKIWLSVAGGQLIERHYIADTGSAPYTYSTYPNSPSLTRRLGGCATGTAANSCVTPGMISTTGSAFVPYYPQTAACPPTQLLNGTLCKIDTNSPQTVSDAVAVSISFTIATPGGRQSRGFTTLASVSGSSG